MPSPQQPSEVTPLSPLEEALFRSWAKASGVTDVDDPRSFYDYRGYWKDIASKGGDSRRTYPDGPHFPDTYKQHGHSTFSIESRYSKGPTDGGRWNGETFIPQVQPMANNEQYDVRFDGPPTDAMKKKLAARPDATFVNKKTPADEAERRYRVGAKSVYRKNDGSVSDDPRYAEAPLGAEMDMAWRNMLVRGKAETPAEKAAAAETSAQGDQQLENLKTIARKALEARSRFPKGGQNSP